MHGKTALFEALLEVVSGLFGEFTVLGCAEIHVFAAQWLCHTDAGSVKLGSHVSAAEENSVGRDKFLNVLIIAEAVLQGGHYRVLAYAGHGFFQKLLCLSCLDHDYGNVYNSDILGGIGSFEAL